MLEDYHWNQRSWAGGELAWQTDVSNLNGSHTGYHLNRPRERDLRPQISHRIFFRGRNSTLFYISTAPQQSVILTEVAILVEWFGYCSRHTALVHAARPREKRSQWTRLWRSAIGPAAPLVGGSTFLLDKPAINLSRSRRMNGTNFFGLADAMK